MKNKVNSFDFISHVYDALATLVFGSALRRAQLHYLDHLKEAKQVLILGGGTGWLLAALLEINGTASITYIEASMQMLAKSRKLCGNADNGRVQYIHGTQNDIPDKSYDAVITNFYMDLFREKTLDGVVNLLHGVMSSGSILLVSDFNQPKTLWQRAQLRFMYAFFRLVANIETLTLPDWRRILGEHGFYESYYATFYAGFVRSSVFRK